MFFLICLYHTMTTFEEKTSENFVGKGENAGNQHFHLFPQYFPPYQKEIVPFQQPQCSCFLQMLSIWLRLTFCPLGKGLVDILSIYHFSMGECNTILSAYTKYRHLDSVALTCRSVN